jgi:luciferase family oxidoreductase group 1
MKTQSFRLGALDFCRAEGRFNASEALWDSIALAPRLEEFGYARFWMAEHHTNLVAHSSPEIMTAIIAGLTNTMRIGSAGILLRFYSPFKVASTFRLLHALFPGRIDLGLARGSVDPVIARLLDGNVDHKNMATLYEEKVSGLLKFLRGEGEAVPAPAGIAPPETWMLGSGTESAKMAGVHGTAFCLGIFLDVRGELAYGEPLGKYKAHFLPSLEMPEPKWAVAVAGICAETAAKAQELLTYHSSSKVIVRPTIVGEPSLCRDRLLQLGEACKTKEVIFLDLCKDIDDRIRSYQLLADAVLHS